MDMSTTNIKAHYDGERILLDEPVQIPVNAQLIITVLPNGQDTERANWATAASDSLARAYGDDEPEYSVSDLRA
jgi:hypothetical protein